jgi:hypothetical protein
MHHPELQAVKKKPPPLFRAEEVDFYYVVAPPGEATGWESWKLLLLLLASNLHGGLA